jgi:leucyl aminopeptidase
VDEIVDIATLTGACLIALGDVASALLSNNRRMAARFKKVSDFTGERLWELPLYPEYRDYLDSDIADMMHCTETRKAGTATAAKFLEEFVDKTPWVHLDIAGTMDASSAKGWLVKGMTGSNTRNLIGYVMGH